MALSYNTIYNQALNAIKSTCYNVSRYSSLPSQFKSGYTTTKTAGEDNLCTWTFKISNPVNSISTSTVDSDFSELMKQYGITPSGEQVTPGGLYNFYTALSIFCTARVCMCSSQFNSGVYPVYDRSANYQTATKLPVDAIAYAIDGIRVAQDIIKIITANSKARFIRYTIS